MSDEGMSDAELAYHRARAYQRPGSTDTEMTIEKESMRALIARLDAAERERDALREALRNPPKHVYWGAGEPDCPRDILASNGELHTLRCKVCGKGLSDGRICLAGIVK
jgi:hypothetical protein